MNSLKYRRSFFRNHEENTLSFVLASVIVRPAAVHLGLPRALRLCNFATLEPLKDFPAWAEPCDVDTSHSGQAILEYQYDVI